ncbi:MAG TPA: hypothetical protein VNJ01_06385 [Bacteriovoracaceae bacterium]|nr:hypothetical protein [Bacteriovoracaceae bacterium]
MFYKFQSAEKSQEFKRTFNSRHCIATPAFCTTAIFSFAKKFEPGLRIPVSIISTDNVWDYQGPPKEKVVYIEAKSKDKDDFLAEKLPIDSSLFYLHENASASTIQDPPVELVISRDHCIPYQMTFLDQKIVFHQSKKRDQTLK